MANPQGKTWKNGKNLTPDEAKQAILDMIDQGINYREIAQVEFMVNGRIRKYNIATISGFVKERDKPPTQDEGALAAEAFKLFLDGKGPDAAVVELHILPERAAAFYNSYVTMQELDLSKPSTPRRLKELEKRLDNLNVIEELTELIRDPYNEDQLDSAPEYSDIYTLLNSAKLINSLPITNLGVSTCSNCGSKGKTAVHYKCTKCGAENWWGHWK